MTEPRHLGWLRACGLAILTVLVTTLGFLYVPDQLALRLSDAPALRDGLVVAWTSIFFALASWGFVRIQVRRIPTRLEVDGGTDQEGTR